MLVYDSDPPVYFNGPHVKCRLMPSSWGRWWWEVTYKYRDDKLWTHYLEYDGRCFGFRRAILKADSSADDCYFELIGVNINE